MDQKLTRMGTITQPTEEPEESRGRGGARRHPIVSLPDAMGSRYSYDPEDSEGRLYRDGQPQEPRENRS